MGRKEDKKTKDKYRQFYEKASVDSELEVDKYIKYLAGGALVLSLSFIGKILPNGNNITTENIWLIITGWFLLVVALIVNFSSQFLTIRSSKLAVKEIDNDDDCWTQNVISRNKTITLFNYLAAILSIFGIIGITLFVSFNI